VLAAAVWVGGQVVLAGLVGPTRRLSAEAPRALARAFARLSWPAFAVLLATGIWNIAASHPSEQSSAWRTVLWVKVAVVVAAGVGAGLHTRAKGPRGLALWGSVAGLASVTALVLGVLLAG
jgi:putative copper export protein